MGFTVSHSSCAVKILQHSMLRSLNPYRLAKVEYGMSDIKTGIATVDVRDLINGMQKSLRAFLLITSFC